MKIIYLIHQFYPEFRTGTEKFVLNSAHMAQIFGNKVKIITYSFAEDKTFENDHGKILSKEFMYESVPVLAFKYKQQPDDLHFALENPNLVHFAQKVLEKESPDIIHVGHPMRVHEFIRIAYQMGIPYIITLTDFFLLCPKFILSPDGKNLCTGPKNGSACSLLCSEFDIEFIKTRLGHAKRILNRSAALIGPSQFIGQMYRTEVSNLNIRVINHGIKHKYLRKNTTHYSGSEHIVFGYAGTLIHHKGIEFLLRSFREIQNDNIELIIYGSGEENYVKMLKEIVDKDQRITFYNEYSSEEIGDVFEKMDVLIIPSLWYETYCFVLHESLASNVPVIVTNLGGLAEKVKDGFNGFTFPMGNSEALRKKINMIVEDPTILNDLKENIRKFMIIPKIEQEAYEYFKIYKRI